jgi:CRISPR-associated endonuclease/helicase Cas3
VIDFAGFYRSAHKGRDPFPWQNRLAAQVLASGWPATIDVPTGCGKTSVIDVAVFALAAQAGLSGRERTAPLRVFFVIDRRLVVDDVYAHARDLAQAIEDGASDELRWVGERLRRFGGRRALDVAVLRGGMYRSSTWVDAPNQPLVCVSTVDQVGSRLLFRGYGVSDSRRPVDAGLVGNDSLAIVDEAHLSQPFLDTLAAVERYQGKDWRDEWTVAGLRFVRMSATVRSANDAFQLDGEDLQSAALKPRLVARKAAQLREEANVAESAAKEAVRLADEGAGVVGVVLNTVAAAQAVFRILKDRGEAILLTGRVRPYDRDKLLAGYLDRIRAGRDYRSGERLFVVATQTVEVGADLDFDALVTEAAPLDALRQRFGRLNRLGRSETSPAMILKNKRVKDTDWIYGSATQKTWDWLRSHGGDEGVVDFGVLAMGELFAQTGDESLISERREGPIVFPSHIDAWAQTNPAPAADPDVAPFLHGRDALNVADVQIVWRADLEGDDPRQWVDALAAAPPLSTEALPLPIWVAKRWLAGSAGEVADLEGVAEAQEGEARGGSRRRYLIWRGPEAWETGTASGLQPGDTVIVRSSEGGCDRYGWDPDSTAAVPDIGDLCANRRAESGGGKFRLRVHPMVLFPDDSQMRMEIAEILKRVAAEEDEVLEELREFVLTWAAGTDLEGAAGAVRWGRAKSYGGSGGLLVESERVRRRPVPSTLHEVDETDEDDTSSMTLRIPLDRHTEGVARKAMAFAAGCGLTGPAGLAVVAAAQRHDEGKRDERFQLLLGNLKAEPLAKGLPCSRAEFLRRRRDSGYTTGARHEFDSVLRAAASPQWPEECDRELALYLIGTHHGYGRPFPPVWKDGETASAEVARLDSGWVERYWELTRKYGWWGLAYLEAMLRRADCVRSREEEEEQQ